MAELDLQRFVKQDPQTILKFVRTTMDKEPHPNDEFNWLGLAEVASSNARLERNLKETALLWATIADLVYAYLGTGRTKVDRTSFECSAMLLRVACIARFGPQQEEVLLNPQSIVDWFFANTGMSLDDARERSKRFTALARVQILELRQIKNRLHVVRELYMLGHVPSASVVDVENWLAIREELP